MGLEGTPWFLKWNAGSCSAPPVQDANSTGWAGADAFGAAEGEACELPCPALLPGTSPVSTGSAAPIELADAECDGGEWPWPDVTPGSVGSLAADAFAAAEFEACCELPCPALLPGAPAVSTGSAAPIVLADAECGGGEWPWPDVTPGSVGSLAADAFAAAEFEACCELPCPALLPGAPAVSTGSAAPIELADAECAWGRVAVAGCDARFCRIVGG